MNDDPRVKRILNQITRLSGGLRIGPPTTNGRDDLDAIIAQLEILSEMAEKSNETIRRLHASQAATLNMMEDAEEARRETKKAMGTLRESEERFKSLVSNIPGVIYRCANDPHWTMEFISDVVEDLSGYPVSDFIHNSIRSYASIIHPEDLNLVDRAVQEGVRQKIPYVIEYRIIRASGEIRWVYEKGQGIFDSQGRLSCLHGAIFDMTERKKTERYISSLNDAFLRLGPDKAQNVQLITRTCGEILGAACALYNRLEKGMLCSIGQWNTPDGFNPKDHPEGHICYDLIRRGREGGVFTVRNLLETNYFKTDPNVAAYGLKTYIGHPVNRGPQTVGALCAVFQHDVELGNNEKMVLGVLAKALENEEDRWAAHEKLRATIKELEETQDASLNIMADLDRQRKELDKGLREKDVLLREIHHRVKNNMQIISSLLKLQGRAVDDPRYQELLQECENRIKSMALVHEKLYRTEDLAEIDFRDYAVHLADSIGQSFGISPQRVGIKTDIEEIFLGVDVAIPCGLILNELLANALKHAFSGERRGEVVVQMRKTEGEESEMKNQKSKTELVVSDNGVGFPDGLDFRKTDSLGLHLVNILVNQLRGTIKMEKGEGTRFSITFEVR